MSQRPYDYPLLSYAQWRFLRAWQRIGFRGGTASRTALSVPPPVMVLLAIISVQLGAVLAKGLMPVIGSLGTVFLRQAFAAIVLWLYWRPRLRDFSRKDYLAALLFGVVMAGMNASFYASLTRIPLGIASTLEFVGPLGISVISSRRRLDIVWAGLAVAGVVLLAPVGNSYIDPIGVGLALLAGACWAGYILLNVRVGQLFPGGSGLAIGMSIAALTTLPFGIVSGGHALLSPSVLLLGIGMAMLSTVVPFSLEMETLRRLPPRVFGVLMSLEPAIAALVGFVALKETTSVRALIALVLIVMATGGSSFFQPRNTTRDPQ
jgi:inner membrane transporter RhtA